ncbi:hypothetical protein, partial [Bacillus sp. MUM 13]|uniref:hypothetical protein n=1 Tax=Bacillus sp. MUM 13 TaxID=1678001 RepID=UPI00196B942D
FKKRALFLNGKSIHLNPYSSQILFHSSEIASDSIQIKMLTKKENQNVLSCFIVNSFIIALLGIVHFHYKTKKPNPFNKRLDFFF